jgi:hypothetical protein
VRADLVRLGSFGSYARDLVAVVERSPLPFERRGTLWCTEALPVPAEILVYTRDERERPMARGGRFAEALARETVWLHP